jgi:hypothetical protein
MPSAGISRRPYSHRPQIQPCNLVRASCSTVRRGRRCCW